MTEHLDRTGVSRRSVLAGTGALVFSFSISRALAQQPPPDLPGPAASGQEPPKLAGSLKDNPFLDAWIRIDAQGKITVFTGKAELGQFSFAHTHETPPGSGGLLGSAKVLGLYRELVGITRGDLPCGKAFDSGCCASSG